MPADDRSWSSRISAWSADAAQDLPMLLEEALRRDAPLSEIQRGLARCACRAGSPGDLEPIVVLDAVWDLLPIFGSEAGGLLLAAACYLGSLPWRELRPEWLERAPLSASGIVYAGSLDEVLESSGLETAGGVVARLLSVMQTPEAFHELILETAARQEDGGKALIQAGAVIRGMRQGDWAHGRSFLFRLLEAFLAGGAEPTGPRRAPDPGAIPYGQAYLTAARAGGDLAESCLFLTHAYQADRYCQARRAGVRAGIAATLRAWPGWAAGEDEDDPVGRAAPRGIDAALRSPQPGSGGGSTEEDGSWMADAESGEGMLSALERGAAGEALDRARILLGGHTDPDPLFRWIAPASFADLARGEPRRLLLVNGARWGLHLLRGRGHDLLGRVLQELAGG